MWLIVSLTIWDLLSHATTVQNDELIFTDPETWGRCLALLTPEKSSPRQTSVWDRQSGCKNWRPKVVPKTTPQARCVFSQASFRNDNGLGLVTTSQTVSDLLHQGILDEREQCDLYGSVSPWDIVPGPVLDPDTTLPAYEVRSLPDKGQGVIALRRINQNETFLIDHPTILVSWVIIGLPWTQALESFLEDTLDHLSEDTRKRIIRLSSANLIPDLPLCDLFKTNACGLLLGTGAGALHAGLFTEFAANENLKRINHACNPNAFYRVSPRDLMIEVVAFRDIEPGEEIYINYAPFAMTGKERQKFLQSQYGFTCTCSLCTGPEAEQSDRQRMEMAALRDETARAMRRRRWADAARHASESLEKLSEAQVLAPGIFDYSLTPLYLDYYEDLARIHIKMGDVGMAKGYGEKALEMISYIRGVHSHHAQELRRFLRGLEE